MKNPFWIIVGAISIILFVANYEEMSFDQWVGLIPEPLPVDIDTYDEYDGSEDDFAERLLLDYDDLDEFDEWLEFGDDIGWDL